MIDKVKFYRWNPHANIVMSKRDRVVYCRAVEMEFAAGSMSSLPFEETFRHVGMK